jgi:NADH:ubiquinone oxidoreductase subunit 6 (subunit J)
MLELQPYIFWVIASLTGLCAVATVVTQNIVRSATWLLFTLAGTSGIFFLLGADIIGAVQLLVYVGGTMVLVIFGVMLTAQGPFINMKTSGAEWAISIVAGIMLFAVLCYGATSYVKAPTGTEEAKKDEAKAEDDGKKGAKGGKKDFAKKGDKDGKKGPAKSEAKEEPRAPEPPADPKDSRHAATIGQALLGAPYGPTDSKVNPPQSMHYLLPFEIVSIHLLVVLIGAAYLARAKRRKGETA